MKATQIEVENAAKLLGISDTTLQRWIKQGKIPAHSQGRRYFLNREELERWAQKRNVPLFECTGPENRNEPLKHFLTQAMRKGGVLTHVGGDDVRGLLQGITRDMPLPDAIDRTYILDQLLQREALVSTGIGHGVALPHPRHPISSIPPGGQITTCYLEQAVPFGSVDGEPVSVLFVLLSPNTACHLKLLSRLSFCLRDNDFISKLKKRPSPEDLYSSVLERENRMVNSEACR